MPQLPCLSCSNVVFFQPLLDMPQNQQVCAVRAWLQISGTLPSSRVIPQMYALHGSCVFLGSAHFFLRLVANAFQNLLSRVSKVLLCLSLLSRGFPCLLTRLLFQFAAKSSSTFFFAWSFSSSMLASVASCPCLLLKKDGWDSGLAKALPFGKELFPASFLVKLPFVKGCSAVLLFVCLCVCLFVCLLVFLETSCYSEQSQQTQ